MRKGLFAGCAAILLGLATPATAVQPKEWTHGTEADFAEGARDDLVVTNYGDLRLGAALDRAADTPAAAELVYDVRGVAKALYVAAGPHAQVYRRGEDGLDRLLVDEEHQAFALGQWNGEPVVALSGPDPRLVALGGDEPRVLARLGDVRYVWAVVAQPDRDRLLVATGTPARVLVVHPGDGEAAEVSTALEAPAKNVLALTAAPDGRIYAGTDQKGLIYRLAEDDGGFQSFVVYDAPEPEIGSLAVGPDGAIYAGTADAEQAKPGKLDGPGSKEKGRPTTEPEGNGTPDEVPPDPSPVQPESEKPGEGNEEDRAGSTGRSSDADADVEPKEPTPEQRDRLREAIREQLREARETGELQAPAPGPSGGHGGGGSPPTPRPDRSRNRDKKKGNAVYRIDSEGYVHELFRESIMALELAVAPDGRIWLGTGNAGKLFALEPDSRERAIVAELEADQVAALAPRADGGLWIGTANPGGLWHLSGAPSESGTYTSPELDANQVSLWGRAAIIARVPAGAKVVLETRSGNVGTADASAWSPWTKAGVLEPQMDDGLRPRPLEIASPPARYLQYRLRLERGDGADAAPVIRRVSLTRLMPNLAPRISAIKTKYEEPNERQGATAKTKLRVQWKASDPNGDALRYDLFCRRAGSAHWLPIAEEIEKNKFKWDTRRVADGSYQLEVRASDAPDNPSAMSQSARRRSAPVRIDNTAPSVVEGPSVEARPGEATITLTVADETGTIAAAGYAVDATEDYATVLPKDLIFDQGRETLSFTIPDLEAGAHAVTVRIRDGLGNTRHVPVEIEVPAD